ncbi:uncharacterized protein K444DRAFT_417228 [Hyaloscypha bicolor E]|uniref:Uncharacterized protein n=1 Tax=Hyaloscypha bicolor E TaxID=1095630 RepID=A0A2J6T7D8_9HELO|nr:uncharacterized protein K444DRAFT_417228 [Hyaloscypha bicolor E]PMD58863.1 hypothetical protein K444DRAFT_417228 [Hyaloscypha bicolor E]
MRKRGGGVGGGAGLGAGFGILVHGRSVSLHYFVYFYYASHPFPSCPSLDHRLAWPGLSGWLAGWLSIFCQSSASPLFGSSSARPPSLSELRAAAFLTTTAPISPDWANRLSKNAAAAAAAGSTHVSPTPEADQIRSEPGASCCVKVLSLCLRCLSVSRRPVAAEGTPTTRSILSPRSLFIHIAPRPDLSSSPFEHRD